MPPIALALGSNLGSREKNLCTAIECLKEHVTISKISEWLENAAVGGEPGQGNFLNGALTGSTELSAQDLLKFIKSIEKKIGRNFNAPRWSAREIDIDIIFYGQDTINTPILTIPHILMHRRDFVLIPLAEIIPDHIHPVLNKSVNELKNAIT